MASLTPTPYARQIANATDRGDAHYFVGPGSGLRDLGNGYWTDETYTYDSNGLSTNRPNQYVPGIGSSDDSASFDPWTGRFTPVGGGGGGGGSFGPEFDQMLQDLKAQSVSDKASRDAAIQRSFINFGLGNLDLAAAAKTTGIGDLASVLDQNTLTAAANNKFSVMERLKQALSDQQRQNRVSLRQRGGVRSGESGFLAQRAQTAFDTDTYDSTQKLLDYITGAQQGYAQAERARQMQAWQAALAAAMNARGGGGGGGGSAPSYNTGDPFGNQTNPQVLDAWAQARDAQNALMAKAAQAAPKNAVIRTPRDFLNY